MVVEPIWEKQLLVVHKSSLPSVDRLGMSLNQARAW
jgi:hypothetical protein